jgi:hypothetical protein
MSDNLPVHCPQLSPMFVPGERIRLVLDSPAGLQRSPKQVVVSTACEWGAKIEGFVEAAQLQSSRSAHRVAAAAAHTNGPRDQRSALPVQPPPCIAWQADPLVTPSESSVGLE